MPYEEEVDEVQELGVREAKKGVIFVGSQIAVAIVTLVMLVFLARFLQPAEYGLYTIAIAFNGIITIASNFGMGTAFRKMLPQLKKGGRKERNAIISSGYVIALALGVVIAVVAFLVSSYVATSYYYNATLTVPLEIASAAVILTILFSLTQGALVGLGLVKEAAISNFSYSLFNLIGSVGLVLLGFGVVGAMDGLLIGLAVGAVVGTTSMGRKGGFTFSMPVKAVMKRLSAFSAPVVASYVAMQGAQNFSILLLGVYALAPVVGNFGAAYKLARFIELTVTSITFILVGTFAAALARKETAEQIGKIYNRSIYYSALFLFPLIAYVISVAQPLSNVLFGSVYANVPTYFVVMAIGMALGIIGNFAGTLVVSHGDTKRYMKYQVVAVAVQLALLYLFVPSYQAFGVLLSVYLITPIFLNILYMRSLEEQFKFKHEFGGLARITLAAVVIGVLLCAASYLMHQSRWSLAINLAALLLLFPPILALAGGIKRANLEFVQKTGARLKQLGVLVDYLVKYAYIFVRD